MNIDEFNRRITEIIRALVDSHRTDLVDSALLLADEFKRIIDDSKKNLTDNWFTSNSRD